MILTRFAKGHGCLLLLLTALLLSLRRYTRRPHDLGQVLLILRRMKGPVERGALDLAAKAFLQLSHDRHDQVLIQHTIADHAIPDDKTHSVLDYQHIVTKLNRQRLLATLDQLRVRLEDAENLLVVG